jgi:hypothetical protein
MPKHVNMCELASSGRGDGIIDSAMIRVVLERVP